MIWIRKKILKSIKSSWSIRYTMSKKEMDEVNNKSEELDLRVIQEPKFEGSCLVISTDLIKSGLTFLMEV